MRDIGSDIIERYGGIQNRTFKAQNEITGITGTTSTPSYDNNGNMTVDQNGTIYTYDSWNRLVKVQTASTIEKLVYDANGKLIQTNYPCGGPTTDSYYSDQGQDIEDDQNAGGTITKRIFVWGMSNPDELISRDEKVGSGSTTRIYVQQDPLNSVTALLDSSGNVLQRFQYDVYGAATVLTAAWASSTDGYNWVWRWQGGRFDSVSGTEKIGDRDMNVGLGVWIERDPLGQGSEFYQAMDSNPSSMIDPLGTDALAPPSDSRNVFAGSGAPATQPSAPQVGAADPGPVGPDGQPVGVQPPYPGGRWVWDPVNGPPRGHWKPDNGWKGTPGMRDPDLQWDPNGNHWDHQKPAPQRYNPDRERIDPNTGKPCKDKGDAHDPTRTRPPSTGKPNQNPNPVPAPPPPPAPKSRWQRFWDWLNQPGGWNPPMIS